MEGITEGVYSMNINDSTNKKNRIQVSNTKKPLFFYVNLAKTYMQQYNEVELPALGMAIATVVTIAEILKNNGLAVEKKIMTSTVDMREDTGGQPVPKAKHESQSKSGKTHLWSFNIMPLPVYFFVYCIANEFFVYCLQCCTVFLYIIVQTSFI